MNFSSSRLKAPEKKKKQIDYDLSFDERGQASKETVVLGGVSVSVLQGNSVLSTELIMLVGHHRVFRASVSIVSLSSRRSIIKSITE